MTSSSLSRVLAASKKRTQSSVKGAKTQNSKAITATKIAAKRQQAQKTKQSDPVGTATVTCSALNVRQGPDSQTERIGGLTNGKNVAVYEVKEGWLRIQYEGKDGWICQQYTDYKANTPDPGPQTPDPGPQTPDPGTQPGNDALEVITTDGLNLRTGPGTEHSKILTMPVGTRLTVLEESMVGIK